MTKDIAASLDAVVTFLEADDNLDRFARHLATKRNFDTTGELASETNAIFESLRECADDLANEDF